MIYTVEYSDYDLRDRCYKCVYLKLESNGIRGNCVCKENRVKNRTRDVTDRACAYKRFAAADAGKGETDA